MIFNQQLAGLGFVAQPSAAAPSGVTWDPATMGAGVTLSNGNLTAQATGTEYGNVRSTASKSSGKWYFEIVLETIGSGFMPGVGISRHLPAADNGEFGAAIGGHELRANGDRYSNGTNTSSWTAALTAADIVMVAFDMGAGHVWFGKNGAWLNSGDPAAGTSPAITGVTGAQMAAASTGPSGSLGKCTAKFSPADLSYSPPAGFSAL